MTSSLVPGPDSSAGSGGSGPGPGPDLNYAHYPGSCSGLSVPDCGPGSSHVPGLGFGHGPFPVLGLRPVSGPDPDSTHCSGPVLDLGPGLSNCSDHGPDPGCVCGLSPVLVPGLVGLEVERIFAAGKQRSQANIQVLLILCVHIGQRHSTGDSSCPEEAVLMFNLD